MLFVEKISFAREALVHHTSSLVMFYHVIWWRHTVSLQVRQRVVLSGECNWRWTVGWWTRPLSLHPQVPGSVVQLRRTCLHHASRYDVTREWRIVAWRKTKWMNKAESCTNTDPPSPTKSLTPQECFVLTTFLVKIYSSFCWKLIPIKIIAISEHF